MASLICSAIVIRTCSGFRLQGSLFRIQSLEFGVYGLGFMV